MASKVKKAMKYLLCLKKKCYLCTPLCLIHGYIGINEYIIKIFMCISMGRNTLLFFILRSITFCYI